MSPEGWAEIATGFVRGNPTSKRDERAGQRFTVRHEHFGSLIFDHVSNDYIPFDQEATAIFDLAEREPISNFAARLHSEVDRASLERFGELCKQIGLVDGWGRFNGTFLEPSDLTEGVLSAPVRVHLALTNACNFRCNHCFSSSGSPYPDELTTFEVKQLISELATQGSYQMTFGGGEPLVRRDLPTLLEHAAKHRVAIEISTNAVAAAPEVVNSLRGLPVARFNVSLDGGSAETYDAIRGEKGAFTQALQGICNLKELGAPISLRRVNMRRNAHDLDIFLRLAESLGVEEVVVTEVRKVGRAIVHPEVLLERASINDLWRQASAARYGASVKISAPQQVPGKRVSLFSGLGCKCGQLVCHVDARGVVSPSGLLRDILPAGSLRERSFREIWLDGAGLRSTRGLPRNETCAGCLHFSGCRGGCRASVVLAGHEMNSPHADCTIAYDV